MYLLKNIDDIFVLARKYHRLHCKNTYFWSQSHEWSVICEAPSITDHK